MNKSVKKNIYWGLFIGFIVGSIITGSPFNLIDVVVVRPIVNILFIIFNFVHDFGLAIIIFTVLVKLLMWPLTKKQLNQAKLMRKLQPELTQIKKNCKGNKQLESLQTMDLYKRYNVKPFASILTLIIQLPIFIAIFSAIRVIATPIPQDNLFNRAYGFVAYEGSEIKVLQDKQKVYLEAQEEYLKTIQEDKDAEIVKPEYDFHPQLFGVINLDVKASDVMNGKFSWSALFILICAILASAGQYYIARQQKPSGKSEKSKKFRDLIREAKEGKEIEDMDVTGVATGQMTMMMPLMMFFIMFNLNGALAFYYFLSNILTMVIQKIVLNKTAREIDDMTDKAVLKELRDIQEAKVIENKKTGTKITRIKASDTKKKRR